MRTRAHARTPPHTCRHGGAHVGDEEGGASPAAAPPRKLPRAVRDDRRQSDRFPLCCVEMASALLRAVLVTAGNQGGRLPEDELNEARRENVVTEDDENFQEAEDRELRHEFCRADVLAELSVAVCASAFEQKMATMEADARCVVDNVIRPYDRLSVCLEKLSRRSGCFYPNAAVQSAFLRVHSAFFGRCADPGRERRPEDAPGGAVAVLTLAPVALIPPLVYAVARRSGRR
ncbi:receptor activity-modifying protein 1-like isoform X2 [Phycodurus eques]|uniref:receptor activity-modifying protein 1-like isoform X2 n=1 Tax=Phycodurus eques TaxID=693459 RepID=UPI002ACE87D4|nr:receptor activity-modifying protein 1-like isoform X2 [Phycodurus eques]